MTNKTITSYKGFDKDFKCRGFQYEIGKEYTTDKAECCDSGFHACPMPLSVFNYYEPATSKYALVEQSGDFDQDGDKIASTKIKIKAELSLFDLIKAQVEWVKSQIKPEDKESNTGYRSAATNTGYRSAATNTGEQSAATNTGYYSAATNTGEQSAATNTGYRSAATNTGNYSAATNTGEQSAATVKGQNSVAMACGIYGKAKAKEGGCIVICDWRKDDNNNWYINDIYSAKVGGKIKRTTIEPNTFYWFENGRLRKE